MEEVRDTAQANAWPSGDPAPPGTTRRPGMTDRLKIMLSRRLWPLLWNVFTAPSWGAVARRYLFIVALRCLWFALHLPLIQASFAQSIPPVPSLALRWPEGGFIPRAVDGLFVLIQLGLLLGIMVRVLMTHLPQLTARFGLKDYPAVRRGKGASVAPTVLLMVSLLFLTCIMVSWVVFSTSTGRSLTLWGYLEHEGPLPVFGAGALSLLACLYGGDYATRAASKITASFGVQRVAPNHPLHQRVHAVAEKLGMATPMVGITNVFNAFAMGSGKDAMVVIGKPIFQFEPDELDAIIGHELGHIKHRDVPRMQFAEGFQQMLGMILSFVVRLIAAFTASAAKTPGDARRNELLAQSVGLALRTFVFAGTELVVKGISRSREYHADSVGAEATSVDAMVRALKRIHKVVQEPTLEESRYGYLMFRSGRRIALFATHPTLEARIRSLKASGRKPPPEPTKP